MQVACEIAPGRVISARASSSHDSVEATSARAISGGAIVPGLTGDNIGKRDEVLAAVRDSLDAVGSRSRDVIVVIPDLVVRVVLLDFEQLPDKHEEADGVIRFRLKKSLPFDVEKAQLSYERHKTIDGVRVVTAVAQTSVVEQYESIFREAGYQPGIVLPSTLAALGAVSADKPTLVLKIDKQTTTVTIVDQDQLLLFRTLEGGAGEVTGERIAEDVYPSLVFLQDNYGVNVERVLVAGIPNVGEIAPVLQQQTGARVSELVDSMMAPGATVSRGELAGVVGALMA